MFLSYPGSFFKFPVLSGALGAAEHWALVDRIKCFALTPALVTGALLFIKGVVALQSRAPGALPLDIWLANQLSRCGVRILSVLEQAGLYWFRPQLYNDSSLGTLVRNFRKLELQEKPVDSNHPHGYEAMHRSVVHLAMKNLVRQVGMDVYEISFSGRSQARGYHQHHSVRDLAYPPRYDRVTDRDVLCLVDVDYYADMHFWASWARPMLIYTMAPRDLVGNDHNTAWEFNFDGTLTTTVKGGGVYHHRLWNYDVGDYIEYEYYGTRYIYRLDKKNVGMQHYLVLLTPVVSTASTRYMEHVPRATCVNYVYGNGLAKAIAPGRLSLRVPGYYSSIEINQDLLRSCHDRWNRSKQPNVSDLEAVLRSTFKENTYVIASAVASLFGDKATEFVVKNFTYYVEMDGCLLPHEPKEIATDVGPSVVDAGVAYPEHNVSNLVAAELLRHRDVANVVVPDAKYASYAIEFTQRVPAGMVQPWEFSNVYEAQDKPAQRSRNARALQGPVFDSRAVTKAFMKKEAYPDIKDPRLISNLNVEHNLLLSRWTYPVKNSYLKTTEWYMPGKQPDEIADRMQNMMLKGESVVETDFSRFDGTISKWLRVNVERAYYARCWPPEALDLLDQEIHAKSHAGPHRYDPNGSRLSGSPLTTDGNTIIAAFVDYATLREIGYGPEEAYTNVGMHFGDDGLSIEATAGTMSRVAAELGLRLKEIVRKGDYVTFLGRVFPWGSRNSFQDPCRVWPKLSTALNRSNDAEQKRCWLERLAAYERTDANTPILGDYVTKVLDLNSYARTGRETTSWYFSGQVASWPNSFSEFEQERALSIICDMMGVDLHNAQSTIIRIRQAHHLASLKTIENVLSMRSSPSESGSRSSHSCVQPIRVLSVGAKGQATRKSINSTRTNVTKATDC